MQELINQLQQMTQRQNQLTERQAQLEQELQQARAAQAAGANGPGNGPGPPGGPGQPDGPAGPGVDVKTLGLLGKPSEFSGSPEEWRSWAAVFEGYAAATCAGLGAAMERAAAQEVPALNATLEHGDTRLSQQLYFMLLMVIKGAPLQIVLGAGRGEGLESWRQLKERFEPRLRTRYVCGSTDGHYVFQLSRRSH